MYSWKVLKRKLENYGPKLGNKFSYVIHTQKMLSLKGNSKLGIFKVKEIYFVKYPIKIVKGPTWREGQVPTRS